MNRIQSLVMVSLAAPMFALGCPALADDVNDGAVADRLEQMQAELQKLREDNQAMRSELDELRYANGDNWLTEKRADEIRALVSDVLADADTRSSLLNDGLMAGWSDGFFLASADGRFKLQLQGQLQFRYVYSYHDSSPSPFGTIAPQQQRHARGFENSRTRLAFRGHVFDRNLTYMVRGDFGREGGSFTLLDAWMRYFLTDEWSVRAGQFKLPFSREFLVFSGHQLAVERSQIDTNMNIGRAQGVELAYHDDYQRASLAYHDGGGDSLGTFAIAGAPNPGTNSAALLPTVEYAFAARYEFLASGTWNQLQDFTSPMDEEFGLLFGVAAHIQRDQATGQPGGTRRHRRWMGYTVDASAEFGGANLFASFTHHYVDGPGYNANIFGVVAQGGVYITRKWEAFARYEWGHWSVDVADFEDAHILTVGTNYYLDGHDAKWTTDIGVGMKHIDDSWGRPAGGVTGWRIDPDSSRPQVVFRTQFQLLF